MNIKITIRSEESEELVSESELSLDEVLEEPESESESSVARLTFPLDLLFFFFFRGHLRELCPDLPHLEHLCPNNFLTARLTADLIAFTVALFSVNPAILSVISSTGS